MNETKDLVETLALGVRSLVKQNWELIRENRELAMLITEYKKNSETH